MTPTSTKIFYTSALILGVGFVASTPAFAQLPAGFSYADSVNVTNTSAGLQVWAPGSTVNGLVQLNSVPPTQPNIEQALQGYATPRQITPAFPTPSTAINQLANYQPGNPIGAGNLLNYNKPNPSGPTLPNFPWRPGYSSEIGTVGGNVDLGSNLQLNAANWDTARTTVSNTFNNLGTLSVSSLTRGDWFNQVEGNSLVLETNYNQANNTQFAKKFVDDFFGFYQPLFNTTIGDVIPSLASSLIPSPPSPINPNLILNTPVQAFLDDAAGGIFDAEYVYNALQEDTPGTGISGFQRISNPNLGYVLEVDASVGGIAEEYLDYVIEPTINADRGILISLETSYFGSDVIFQITQEQSLLQAITETLNELPLLPGTDINALAGEAFDFFLANPVQLIEPAKIGWTPLGSSETEEYFQYAWQAAVSGQYEPNGIDPDFPADLSSLEFLGKSFSGTYDPVISFAVPDVPPPNPTGTPEPSGLIAILGLGGLFAANRKKKQS